MARFALVAFFYPPSRASGVYRALAISNELTKAGHECVVFTTSESFFHLEAGPPDESLLGEIDTRVDIVRVPFSRWPVRNDLRQLNPFAIRFGPILERCGRLGRKLLGALRLSGFRLVRPSSLDDRYSSWFAPCSNAILSAGLRNSFDAIIATGNPWTSFAIAHDVSAKTGTPYVLDYRDPWKLDVKRGFPLARSRETELSEATFLRDAKIVSFPNQSILDSYVRIYPALKSKSILLENGFDDGCLPVIHESDQVSTKKGYFRFGTLGTASYMWPINEFVGAWRLYSLGYPDDVFTFAGHLGWFDDQRAELLQKINEGGPQCTYIGPLERQQVRTYYSDIDAFVGFFWGGASLTAGKMYEIAAIGIPILCIQPQGGGVREFLSKHHPAAVFADPDTDSVLEGLQKLRAVLTQQNTSDALEVRRMMRRFSRQSLMRPFIEELEHLVNKVDSDAP